MSGAPTRIWICVKGKDAPEWVVALMTTCDIAENGGFEIDASEGPTQVEPGMAVFEVAGQVFACPPRLVQSKIATATVDSAPIASTPAIKATPRAGTGGIKIKPAIGKRPVIEWVQPGELLIDPTYQRSVDNSASQALIRKIAANWNWELCVPLIVSRRLDGMYVIDGQHRVLGAQMRRDIDHLPCSVHNFAGPAAEAELFIQANRARKPMQRLDDFHAALAAGDEDVAAIEAVVRQAGLVVGRNQAWQHLKPGEVVFTGAIARRLRKHGEEMVVDALAMIAEAFADQPLTTAMPIFDSLCIVLADAAATKTPFDRGMMVAVLKGNRMETWRSALAQVSGVDERQARMLASVRDAYAEAVAE